MKKAGIEVEKAHTAALLTDIGGKTSSMWLPNMYALAKSAKCAMDGDVKKLCILRGCQSCGRR
jgi:hypothetical protein